MGSIPIRSRHTTRTRSDSPTPHVRSLVSRAPLSRYLVAVLAAASVAGTAAGQQRPRSAVVPSRADNLRPLVTVEPFQGAPDSLRPPLSPGRAFLNSFLLPGLGQARLRRHLPGAIYLTVEAVSFAMLYKTNYELRIAKARIADRVVNRYQVDPTTGAPVLDTDGFFVPVDTVESYFDTEIVNSRRSQFEDWITMVVINHLFSGADAFVASLLWDVPARVGFRPAPSGPGLGITVRW